MRFQRWDGTTLTNVLTLAGSGAATFAGAIAIGNTVNTVSPTSPNRTITMVIGGVTYYLHAKTTND
jgi:flagellar capping protein FliD